MKTLVVDREEQHLAAIRMLFDWLVTAAFSPPNPPTPSSWRRTKARHDQALRPHGDEITLDEVERIAI